jgi:hypothetical protein
MGLTTLPTQTEESLGKVKKATPLAREMLPDYDVTPEQHNALVAAVVDIANEVGLSDGSTSGSLVERVDELEAGRITTRAVSASATLTASDSVVLVNTSAGIVTLTLPAPVDGTIIVVKKTTLDTYQIVVDPPASEAVEGGTAGTSITLPSSDIALRGSWTLLCDGVGWWLV